MSIRVTSEQTVTPSTTRVWLGWKGVTPADNFKLFTTKEAAARWAAKSDDRRIQAYKRHETLGQMKATSTYNGRDSIVWPLNTNLRSR